jgi:hypothetical protein
MTILASPETEAAAERDSAYQYLLLGELRWLLEEASNSDNAQRWLIAVLDRLLATYLCEDVPHHFAADSSWSPLGGTMHGPERWKKKLQRLRDRIAHRAPYQILANEIRCDLRLLMDPHRL